MKRSFVLCSLILLFWFNAQSSIRTDSLIGRDVAPVRIATVPVEITNDNLILMKASVNGSKPLTFILDTAAGSGFVLDLQRARELGLKLEGKGSGGGTGEATFETTSAKGVRLSFSGMELKDQTLVVYSSDKIPSIGRTVDGVIGYKLFSHYVVEIDYAAQVVNLYEPKNYQYTGSGESIPLTILSNLPFVMANVGLQGGKSIEGGFLIDTGAGRFTLILNTPFVETNRLLTITQRVIREPGARGVGGETKLFVGRLSNLQLGHFTLAEPIVHFAQDQKGSLASSEFNGVIGGEFLRRFKVIFDYAHKRMILESNAHFAERSEYDMSGIRLRAEGEDFKTFKVQRMVENSPATDAGLQEGDIISAIDSKPAKEYSLSQINQMFKQDGKEYLLSITRGKEKKQIRIKLRRLI